MGRSQKTGLSYFPFDVDMFDDEKIVCIAGEFGLKGEITVVKLLCAIYREGYFIQWTDAQKMKLLRKLPGVSAELLDQIVDRLFKWGVLYRGLFESATVLTSEAIQRRYFHVARGRIKKEDYPYLLIDAPKYLKNNDENISLSKKGVSVSKKAIFDTEIPKENKIYIVVNGFTREEFLKDFFKEERRGTIEQFCRSQHISIDELKEYAEEAVDYWQLTSEPVHSSIGEAQKHLVNYVLRKMGNIKKAKREDKQNDYHKRRST